eukprot:TRINITY_DN7199_c0_g1_i1.p1 TRINITY_DN7199_c0_g1~~TRINITY_DN7199_c0_g1_i1.p1  ORF type:complete len:367 (+),score=138.53 TRINITY_DN7199_c0_g1_i1:33-1133(+)
MALVASYGGDSSSDESCSEDESPTAGPSVSTGPKTEQEKEDPFTDEETDFPSTKTLTSSLPQPVAKETSGYVDEAEDVSDIPKERKTYSEEEVSEPRVNGVSKKKVQIKLPTMKSLFKDMGPEKEGPTPGDNKPKLSGPRSSINSFLPPPKHISISSLFSSSSKPPAFVPRSLTKKKEKPIEGAPPAKIQKKNDSSDSEDDSGGEGGSFFSFGEDHSEELLPPPSLPLPSLNPSMEVPLEAQPLLGPSKPSNLPSPSQYPSDLMTDEAALERLAGRHSLRKKEHLGNVLEINGEDNRADPKVWMTKALTEDETSKPGPRVTIKGVQKSRHQITYLAQLAKANEFKLQQEWANNAHTRRQSAQKYGF